tara:strand:- start:1478 stop:1939 length:462 start_codon:yes stop_codon:yes gene_type:complete
MVVEQPINKHMVHFGEPAIYTLQELVGMSLNIVYQRSIKEENQDSIEISCCKEGNEYWAYALKVLTSIANKSNTRPHIYFDWGKSSSCTMRVAGSWNAESMTSFLRKASSKRAIESGLFNGRRTWVFNHKTEEYERVNEEDIDTLPRNIYTIE